MNCCMNFRSFVRITKGAFFLKHFLAAVFQSVGWTGFGYRATLLEIYGKTLHLLLIVLAWDFPSERPGWEILGALHFRRCRSKDSLCSSQGGVGGTLLP